MPAHAAAEYESELHRLHEQLLLLGAKVEAMIASSMRALVERDSVLARHTIDSDHQINRLEVETDDLCLRILARRQPVASDLRLITIALKIVTDLERIGDLGVNICERAIELNMEPPLQAYIDLPRMAEIAQGMVREALDAFVSADVERARRVIDSDRTVDAYYAQVFRELLTFMLENPANIYRVIRAQAIAKYLERIGDHATNLAEMVVFMVMGKDIRHMSSMGHDEGAKRLPRGVLFLCVRNSSRSQIAEGWARKIFPPWVRVLSAGSKPAERVNPYAVRVMQEVGIDISGQRPKRIGDVPWGDIDEVITLCAEEICPLPPLGVTEDNWALQDPAVTEGTEAEILEGFRNTREEVKRRLEARVAEFGAVR